MRNVAIGFKTRLCVKRFVLRRNFLKDFLHPVPVLTQPCLHLQCSSARHMARFRVHRAKAKEKLLEMASPPVLWPGLKAKSGQQFFTGPLEPDIQRG